MDATNDAAPGTNETTEPLTGTKDGTTAADHDQPYRFGHRPTTIAPYPFSERQYARLLILRSRLQASGDLNSRVAA